ncbi:MAG TPA: amidophosphoribosyltransferase [Bacillota bacterium]|jgi:amidophosphoribosyltransferase
MPDEVITGLDDKVHDACGVFGIYGHPQASRLTYYGLYALQHRGQESAGIVSADGGRVHVHKGMGLVSEVFDDIDIDQLSGHLAIGHVRYSTTGSSLIGNAQPLLVRYRRGMLALAHNGNLVNAGRLRRQLEDQGSIFQTSVDTEVIAHLVARLGSNGLESAIAASLSLVRGGYALLFLTEDRIIGVRDPNGIRPLALGKLGEAWVLASESCAFDTIGGEFVREVGPGEMIILSERGMESRPAVPAGRPALCAFEFIYLARPDSNLNGHNVHAVRKEFGRRLARDYPVEADIVVGVPDSSISAATGYAEEAGIPYEIGLIKNRYIGRTFIQPSQSTRQFGVRVKLNPLRKVINGKRVVLVDDSIVRGTTSRHLVKLLREAGAREVHLRIGSPPYMNPCFFGIDTSASGELIAAQKAIEDIRQLVGADSLDFLKVEALAEATGLPRQDLCVACFNRDYPVEIEPAGKFDLEMSSPAMAEIAGGKPHAR